MSWLSGDIRFELALEIEGIPEVLVSQESDLSAITLPDQAERDVYACIGEDAIAIEYGRANGWKGVADPGVLNLELFDHAGRIAQILSEGSRTRVTESVAYDDTSVYMEDPTIFDVGDLLYLHRECMEVATVEATCVTVARNQFGIGYTPFHDVARKLYSGDVLTANHWARTQPYILEGRICRLWGRTSAESTWRNLWTGIVTEVPPSPSAISWTLVANTLERKILDDIPFEPFSGKLAVSEFGDSWIYSSKALSVRAEILFRGHDDSEGVPFYDYSAGSETTVDAGLISIYNDASVAIRAAIDAAISGLETTSGIITSGPVAILHLTTGERYVKAWVSATVLFTEAGDQGLFQITLSGSLLTALGMETQTIGFQGDDASSYTQMRHLYGTSPAITTSVLSTGNRLPVVCPRATYDAASTPGSGKLGDELISWEGYAPLLSGSDPIVELTGVQRGLGGSQATEHVSYYGEDDPNVEMESVYLATSESALEEIARLLLGVSGNADNGDYSEFVGAGVPEDLVDVASLNPAIESGEGIPPPAGEFDKLKGLVDNALSLQIRCLVTRPVGNECLLSVIRTARANATETYISARIEAWHGITVSGGLGDIANVVNIEAGDYKAKFVDADSIAQYGSGQSLERSYPLIDSSLLPQFSHAILRLFSIVGRRYYVASMSLGPEARFVSPGALVDLTLPNSSLCGLWRILSSKTVLSGDGGTVQVSALFVGAASERMYAPSATVDSLDGDNLVLDADAWSDAMSSVGDEHWFASGDTVWVHDPDDWDDGVEATIVSIDETAHSIELGDSTGISAGDVVEHARQESQTEATKASYLWEDEAVQWGD